jgi:hypothetical protein
MAAGGAVHWKGRATLRRSARFCMKVDRTSSIAVAADVLAFAPRRGDSAAAPASERLVI